MDATNGSASDRSPLEAIGSPRRKLRQDPLQPAAIKPRVHRLLPRPGRRPAAVECPDGLGEVPGGDPPVPVGAEELAVDSFLVLLLRLPQLLPDPAPERIGVGRWVRRQ